MSFLVSAGLKRFTASIASPAAGEGAALVGAQKNDLPDAVATTQSKVNRQIVSVEDFGAYGDGSLTYTQMYAALLKAFNSAVTYGHDLYAPPGVYDCGEDNFPFRNLSSSSLLDCGNLTLWCSGTNTVLRTTSTNGADILQLNALKNFHVKGFPTLTGSVSGSLSGSNGVSVTNGWDNVTLEVYALNLPSLDKTAFVDGGKALTLQNGTTENACGLLRAIVIADGCCEGFGFEPDLVTALTKQTQVDVHIMARNCYMGVKHVADGASGPLALGITSGVRVGGSAVDCQHSLVLQRAHGIDVDLQVKSTKTAEQKRLAPSGSAWLGSDTVVDGALINYAKNSRISVRGYAGDCDYKARIGGASSGSSGLTGATEDSEINIDLGGVSAVSDLIAIDSGGNTVKNSRLMFSTATTGVILPAEFTNAENANRILSGANNTGIAALTLVGCTTSPTGTVSYGVDGDSVTLNLPTITGESNSTSGALTGLPAEVQPSSTRVVIGRTMNGGVDQISLVEITGGTITLYAGTTSVMANTGTKGISACSITYQR